MQANRGHLFAAEHNPPGGKTAPVSARISGSPYPLARRGTLLPQITVLAAGIALAFPAAAIGLETVYEKALQYDSGLAGAQAQQRIVEEGVNLSRSTLLPQVSATAGAEYTDQSVDADTPSSSVGAIGGGVGGGGVGGGGAALGRSGTSDDTYKTYSAGISASQTLYDASAYNEFQASKKQSDGANEDFRQAVLTLTFNSAQAYFDVLRAIDELTTSRRAEAAFKRQWEQAKERFDVGLIAITEVQESRAVYDSGKVDRINAQGQLDIAVENLQRLTGLEIEQINLLASDYPISDPTKVPVIEWEELAYANNPELLAAGFAVDAAEQLLDARRSDLYPDINATASYGYRKLDGQNPVDVDVAQATIGLNLTMPLYLGGGLRANIRQAGYQLDQTQHSDTTVKRNVRVQVRSLYRNLQTNVEAIQARRQQIVSSESRLEATRAGYDVGTRNVVEVLEAESSYYESLSNYANARYDYIINSLSLRRAAGRLGADDIRQLDRWLNKSADLSGIQSGETTVDVL